MKPSTALILDHEGIVVLRRVSSGWHTIGLADPMDPELAAHMQMMRKTARDLSAGQFSTKLVIPNSQILYQELDIGDVAESDKRAALREALDGLTPYDLADLAFDWRDLGDGRAMVAAVAEETLAEAEQFAAEHQFNPICFVAIPPDDRFAGEPFFGESSRAHEILPPGGNVEPDTAAIDLNKARVSAEEQRNVVDPPALDDPAEAAPTNSDPGDVDKLELEWVTPRLSAENLSTAKTDAVDAWRNADGRGSEPRQNDPKDGRGVAASGQAKSRFRLFPLFGFVLSALTIGSGVYLWQQRPAEVASPEPAKPAALAQPVAPTDVEKPSADVASVTEPAAELSGPPPEIAVLSPTLLPPEATEFASPVILPRPLPDPLDPAAPVLLAMPRGGPETGSGLSGTLTLAPPPAPELDPVDTSQVQLVMPAAPTVPLIDRIDLLYLASIDRAVVSQDAVALPGMRQIAPDSPIDDPGLLPPAGRVFDLDEKGFVIATAEGAITPSGAIVFAGPPPVRPLPRPGDEPLLTQAGLSEARLAELAEFRPLPRPEGLQESVERARLAGLSRVELGQFRPQPRPASIEARALAPANPAPSAQAVTASIRPVPRPKGLSRQVQSPVQQTAAAPARATPPPSGASVAQAATIQDGISFARVNLIGIYGGSSNRRALVRLNNGRFVMVRVGDRLDGGNVTAISADALLYTRSGRNYRIELPDG